MRRITFVNACYAPSAQATAQLLGDLATGLAAQGGCQVRVLTTRAEASHPPEEFIDGVQVIRLVPPAATSPAAARLIGWWRVQRAVTAWLRLHLREDEVVVAMTDPPFLAAAVARACRHRPVRMVHWIQDIYPELLSAAALGVLAWPAVVALRGARDRAWRAADAGVTLGPGMADFVASRGVATERIHVSANWSPTPAVPPSAAAIAAIRERWCTGNAFTVVYSGNLGRVHELGACLEVAAALADQPDIKFLFVGDGAQRRALEEMTRTHDLRHVSFHPAVPRAELGAALAAADAHWITLGPGCEKLVYPSKLYGIAAASRPILGIAPRHSDLAHEIARHGLGACFERDQVSAMANQIRAWRDDKTAAQIAGQNALAYSRRNGGAARAVRDWSLLIDRLCPNPFPRSV